MQEQRIPQRIWLASKSPRRQELLHQLGIAFDVLTPPSDALGSEDMVDESILPGESPDRYVSRLANKKASYAWRYIVESGLPKRAVLAADTTVAINGQILGKPANCDEARAMMKRLSGKTHQVWTAITVVWEKLTLSSIKGSDVTFDKLLDEQIEAYIATDEPYDKAGGYGIQGRAGKFIKNINGSYSAIMGLPLFETDKILSSLGIKIK
ncbi:MAG: septum formation inhibitor Maf [Oxalobacter sp.]|jgi:septum formation protein|nr:septum formation inhibitor Maf [Oxalobacter sp.]MBR6000461.1 septum formation inhibitor Maf [Oxalobacter sp.]